MMNRTPNAATDTARMTGNASHGLDLNRRARKKREKNGAPTCVVFSAVRLNTCSFIENVPFGIGLLWANFDEKRLTQGGGVK